MRQLVPAIVAVSVAVTWAGAVAPAWSAAAGMTAGAPPRPAASWGRAIEVPGLAALNKGNAYVNSVSCGSAGNCAAGGYYVDRHHHSQVFVVSQTG